MIGIQKGRRSRGPVIDVIASRVADDIVSGLDAGTIAVIASGREESHLTVVNDIVIDFLGVFKLQLKPFARIEDDVLIEEITRLVAQRVVVT